MLASRDGQFIMTRIRHRSAWRRSDATLPMRAIRSGCPGPSAGKRQRVIRIYREICQNRAPPCALAVVLPAYCCRCHSDMDQGERLLTNMRHHPHDRRSATAIELFRPLGVALPATASPEPPPKAWGDGGDFGGPAVQAFSFKIGALCRKFSPKNAKLTRTARVARTGALD